MSTTHGATAADDELTALRQLCAQQSEELARERATSAALRGENEALRADWGPAYAEAPAAAALGTRTYAQAPPPSSATFSIGPPPTRHRTHRTDGPMGLETTPPPQPGWAPWGHGGVGGPPAPISPMARVGSSPRPASPPTRPPSPPLEASPQGDPELWRDVESGERLTLRSVRLAYPQLGEAQVAALQTTVV